MTQVTITFDDGNKTEIALTECAKEAIRFNFNPSGLATVNSIKALTCALLSYFEYAKGLDLQNAGKEFDVAGAFVQTASMWGVLAATKGL